MRILPIFALSLTLLLWWLAGCGRQRTSVGTPVEYEEGLSQQAWMMLDTGADFSRVMEVQREAVRLLHEGKSREDPVAVLEQMAYFLFTEGRLEEAFKYFNEAEDSLRRHPEHPAAESLVMLYGDLSQFYDRLGMKEKAIAYSDSAIRQSRRIDGKLMPDIWRFRSQIYANDGRTSEAFGCLDSARRSITAYLPPSDTAHMLAIIGGERANLILSLNPGPDSVALAASILRHGRDAFVTPDFNSYFGGAYGYALYLLGRKDEGISLMESAVRDLRDDGDLEMEFLEMRRLLEVYTAEKRLDKVGPLYKEYTLLSDSMTRAKQNVNLVSAKVRADVEAKERENRELQQRLRQKQNQVYVTVGVLLILGILAFVVLMVMRRHVGRMRRSRDKERDRLHSATAMLEEAISERDSARECVESLRSEMSDRMAAVSDDLLSSQSLAGNSGVFIRAFNAKYPRFVSDLRRDCPSLTDTDMVFCMLIFLKRTNGEISESLNISRASVNSARYRIRTKLALSKEDNLDKFLQSRK